MAVSLGPWCFLRPFGLQSRGRPQGEPDIPLQSVRPDPALGGGRRRGLTRWPHRAAGHAHLGRAQDAIAEHIARP